MAIFCVMLYCTDEQILNAGSAVRDSGGLKYLPVSYTHLTLPTILLV